MTATNPFYTSTALIPYTRARAEAVSDEFKRIQAGFDGVLDNVALTIGSGNYYPMRATGVTKTAVDSVFTSDETGTLRAYRRTATYPFYVDMGDSSVPVTRGTLGASGGGNMVGLPIGGTVQDLVSLLTGRTLSNAQRIASYPNGTIVHMGGIAYCVDTSRTGALGTSTASCAKDLGVDNLKPHGIATPQHYGAKGDGVTDDTAALQAAFNALADYKIGHLHLPEGTYKITSAISLKSGTFGRQYYTGWLVTGAGYDTAIIKQFTDNTPHFDLTFDMMHSCKFFDFQLTWANSQAGMEGGSGFFLHKNNPGAAFTASITGNTMTVTALASGNIGVGAKIVHPDVPVNSYVSGYLTGSGGLGTYTISIAAPSLPLAVASSAMTTTATGLQDFFSNHIRLRVTNSYWCIRSDSGSIGMWGNVFDWYLSTFGGCMKMRCSIGQPKNSITGYLNGGATGIYMFDCNANTNEYFVEVNGSPGLMIKDWGGGLHLVRHWGMEGQSQTMANGIVFDLANSKMIASGNIYTDVIMSAGSSTTMFSVSGAEGHIDIAHLAMNIKTTQGAGSKFNIFNGSARARIRKLAYNGELSHCAYGAATPVQLTDVPSSASCGFITVDDWIDPLRVTRPGDADVNYGVGTLADYRAAPVIVYGSVPLTATRIVTLPPNSTGSVGNNLFDGRWFEIRKLPNAGTTYDIVIKNFVGTELARIPAAQQAGTIRFRWDRASQNGGTAGSWIVETRSANYVDSGWAVDTGTGKKTANVTYDAQANLSFSAAYTLAEMNALVTRLGQIETALQNTSRTVKSLKDSEFARGVIGA